MNMLENRIPPPLVFLLVAGAMWLTTLRFDPLDVLAGWRWPLVAVFLMLGLAGLLGIREFARHKTTIDPVNITNASTLVTSGVFAWTRNPMYLGMACLLVAWALYLSVPWTLLGPLAFVLLITRFQIVPEERAMAAKFGADYAAYRARVRRWI